MWIALTSDVKVKLPQANISIGNIFLDAHGQVTRVRIASETPGEEWLSLHLAHGRRTAISPDVQRCQTNPISQLTLAFEAARSEREKRRFLERHVVDQSLVKEMF